MSEENQCGPLLIVGFDAGDPHLLQQWAEEGHLPTLASIMKRGCWAETCGPELMLEHGAWRSIFSGISRAGHGFYYFRQLKPRTYDVPLIYGADIHAPPFWASSNSGKRVLVVDVPEGAIERGVPGLQIANWKVHRGYISRAAADQPASEPAGLLEELIPEFGRPAQLIEAADADPEKNRSMRLELLSHVEKKGALCRHLIQRARPDVSVCCFGESHTAGHQFWRYCAEGSAQRPAYGGEFAHAIRDVYQAIDRQLGLLMAQVPPSTNVVVLSSIGLTDHYPAGALMEDFCFRLGYQAAPEANPISFRPMALLRRMLPEAWRIWLSRCLSRESRERLFAQQFRSSANWRKTTAFAIPSFYTGFLRVNLRGREPEGIVEAGAQYDALLQQLEADLRQLIDPKTGQPAIEKVVRSSELFGCGPPEVLPDLIVHWKSCPYFRDRVLHPKAELTQKRSEFFRDSDHIHRGFVAGAGPAIQEHGRIGNVEVLDLAPTFLALLGEPKCEQMNGNIIKDFIRTKSPVPVS